MDHKTVLIGWVCGAFFLGSVTYRHIFLHPAIPTAWRSGMAISMMVGVPTLAIATGLLSRDLMGLGVSLNQADFIAGFSIAHWVLGIKVALSTTLIAIILKLGLSHAPTVVARSDVFHNAIYDEVHWMFFRAVATLLLNDLLYGTLSSIGIICLEIVIRSNHQAPKHNGISLIQVLSSSTIYFATQNLWLIIISRILIDYGYAYFNVARPISARFYNKGR